MYHFIWLSSSDARADLAPIPPDMKDVRAVLSKGDPSLSGPSNESNVSTRPSKLVCNHCKKSFSNEELFVKHRKKHSMINKIMKKGEPHSQVENQLQLCTDSRIIGHRIFILLNQAGILPNPLTTVSKKLIPIPSFRVKEQKEKRPESRWLN